MKTISCEELYYLLNRKSIILIDIREKDEFYNKHIYGSINIPYDTFINNISKYLNLSFTYYFICNTGFLSQQLATELSKKGYNVISITNGIDDWKFDLIRQNT